MKSLKIACALIAAPSLVAGASELQDPRTRDEDISATTVEVDHVLRGDGLYEYVYTVHAPADNLGYINTFTVDLTCAVEVPGTIPSPPSADQGYLGDHSDDGKHTPATVSADYGQAGFYGITSRNEAQWAVTLHPGQQSTGLRVVSPAPPGLRRYQLIPYMDNDPSWAYPKEPDPTIPWIDDFTVTGVIAGAGCPGVTPSVEEPLFAGSGNSHVEPGNINLLLAYTAPVRDRIPLDASAESVTIEIIYSSDIDPKTFKVQPGYLQALFDPRPGTSQRVEVPLKTPKDRVHFEARSASESGHPDADPDSQSYKDGDVFEFRRR